MKWMFKRQVGTSKVRSEWPFLVISIAILLAISGCQSGANNRLEVSASASSSAASSPSTSSTPTVESPENKDPLVEDHLATAEADAGDFKETASMTKEASPENSQEAPTSVGKENSSKAEPAQPSTKPATTQDKSTTKQQIKQQIDAKYERKFSSLQTSCKAKVSTLSGEVKTYIKNAKAADKEVTVADLQMNFMAKISAAEAGCDKSFNSILASAKQEYEDAGLDPATLNTWSKLYSQSKAQARTQALAQIIAAWKAGSD
jgi:hypothetical protein